MQTVFSIAVDSASLGEGDGEVANLGMPAIGLLGNGSEAHEFVNSREVLATVYVAHIPSVRICWVAWYWL